MNLVRSAIYSNIESYYSFIVAFGTTIAISRILSPAEVGLFSVAMSVSGIASVLREFGASNFLIRSERITPAHQNRAFGITLLLGTILGSSLLGLSNPIAGFFGKEELALLIQILSINFFLLPLGTVNYALIQRGMQFALVAKIGMFASTVSSITSISLALLGFGSYSLAWGMVVLSSLSAVLYVIFGPGSFLMRPMLKGSREMLAFGSKTTLLTMLWEISARFPEFVLGKFLSFASVGLFSRSNGLATNLRDLMLRGLQRVILPYFSRIQREGGNIVEAHYRIATLVTGAGWPAFCLLGIGAEPMTLLLFGEKWLEIVLPLQLLCALFAFGLLFSYQYQVVMVKDELSAQVRTNLINFVPKLALVALGAYVGLEEMCMMLIAWQLMALLVSSRLLYPRIGVSIDDYFKIALTNIPVTIITFFAAYITKSTVVEFTDNYLVTLIALGTGGVIAAGMSMYFLNHPLRKELENILGGSSS